MDTTDEHKINAIEERAHVSKRMETVATVNVTKRIVENLQHVSIPLQREEYTVERIVTNEEVAEPPQPEVQANGDILVSVVEERPVIVKKLFVVEKIYLRKKIHDEMLEDDVVVKKEVIDVERREENGGIT